ncbi:hypothetical protein [Streptococcus mutans]|uniref:hypothetical protein n=2 Tax=Streptococcus mutans TaxID=1309 RepID=UPI000268AAD0|nr:hypothetical protein [Streptococcus mutans]AFM81541.1 hypothetical protein SMUGS5_05150 [Streptococcus mutans GS-5]EMB82028.1 hypothetical protein SMU52_04393 [Streptococcus mutans NFSM2]NLQ45426.1 hypothetical protein [Streptococcus mutans]
MSVSKPKSFEDFFYSKNNTIKTVEEVSDYADKHNNSIDPYDNYMFCPECHVAKLSFVHKTLQKRAFLRKIPSTKHGRKCSYKYDYASEKTTIEYLTQLQNYQVKDKVDSMMRLLFKSHNPEDKISNFTGKRSTDFEDNPMTITNISKDNKVLKSLRRKRFSVWFDKADINNLYIFYGKVKLKVIKKRKRNKYGKEYIFYNLNIYTQNKKGDWNYKTSIYRGGWEDRNIQEDKVYKVVAIGKLNFDYGKFPQIELVNKNKDAFLYKEI